jgi:hypothetical protein
MTSYPLLSPHIIRISNNFSSKKRDKKKGQADFIPIFSSNNGHPAF